MKCITYCKQSHALIGSYRGQSLRTAGTMRNSLLASAKYCRLTRYLPCSAGMRKILHRYEVIIAIIYFLRSVFASAFFSGVDV
jgi:hypothetical protein